MTFRYVKLIILQLLHLTFVWGVDLADHSFGIGVSITESVNASAVASSL
jgi:hypothetical protein